MGRGDGHRDTAACSRLPAIGRARATIWSSPRGGKVDYGHEHRRRPSGPPSTSAVPVGPSVERWQAMSAIERERFFADVFAAFDVPAEPMTKGRPPPARQERGAGRPDPALQDHRADDLRGR